MEPVKRIIVNTGAQYAKALVNICLSLYSTRLVLDALSVSDYGIYAVVAGVVAMLGFMTNALVVTTQRYISYYYGYGTVADVRKLFANSLFLHIVIGLVLVLLLLLPQSWLMNHVLNIEASRLQAASYVYYIMVFMLFVTMITAPVKALFIARENIVYISVVEVCDGVLKLLLAILLTGVTADKLLVYAYMMAVILLVNFLAFLVYARLHFEECTVAVRLRDIDKKVLSRLVGFAGWTTYGMGSVAARNQGTSVILNHFFGTVINAAYGIAFQVQSAVSFLSTSILNAMNPQLMKSEGAGDRQRALMLAERESKYSTILAAMVTVPLMVEMPAALGFWLKEVPDGSVLFCRCILCAFLFDQMTYGLHSLNQALGNIRKYTLLIYTPKLLTLPFIWMLLLHDASVRMVMCFYVAVELLMALVRLPYLKYTAGLRILHFLRQVVFPFVLLCAVLFVTGWLYRQCVVSHSFWVSLAVMFLAGAVVVWFVILNVNERKLLMEFMNWKKGRAG